MGSFGKSWQVTHSHGNVQRSQSFTSGQPINLKMK